MLIAPEATYNIDAEMHLLAVVELAYVKRVSTREVDDLLLPERIKSYVCNTGTLQNAWQQARASMGTLTFKVLSDGEPGEIVEELHAWPQASHG